MWIIMLVAGAILGLAVGAMAARRNGPVDGATAVLRRAAEGDLSARAGDAVPGELGRMLNAVLEQAETTHRAAADAEARWTAQRRQVTAVRNLLAHRAEQTNLLALNANIDTTDAETVALLDEALA